MNNQGNKGIQNEKEKSPEKKVKDMENHDLNDRIQDCNFKKLNKIQENSEKQFSKLRNKINEQKE